MCIRALFLARRDSSAHASRIPARPGSGRYTQHGAGRRLFSRPRRQIPTTKEARKWPVEMSGSPQPSPARNASAGTIRPIRASGTIRSDCSCASTAAGAGATPRIAKRADARRITQWLATVNAEAQGARAGRATAWRPAWQRPAATGRRTPPIRSSTPRPTSNSPRRSWRSAGPSTPRSSRPPVSRATTRRLTTSRLGDERAGDGPAGDGGGDDYDDDDDDLGSDDGDSGGRRQSASTTVSAPRERAGPRLVHFVQGSWRELQRVQWPDRRQVMQATGVVIGFVIVAGVFLGVADLVATKVVKLILP